VYCLEAMLYYSSEFEYVYLGDGLYMSSSLVFDCRSSLTIEPLGSLLTLPHGHHFIVMCFVHSILSRPHRLGDICYSLIFHPTGPKGNLAEDENQDMSLA
jgi:hypothetical protein